MASTRGGHDACESTALTPILPLELIQKITVLAARTHPWTKIPLALSCRDICNWTAQARWHTIIVLNEAQARSLLECVRRHYPLPDDDVQRSPLHGAGSKKAQPLKEDAISLPASLSGCVKALFLHVMPTKPRNADLAMECAEEILRCGSIAGELDVLDIWRFGYEDGRQDSGDRYLVYMPRELTITYVLAAAYPDWPSFYQWHGDGTRLKRLHVIGADFEEPGGITMPYDGLARLRKGSISSSDAGLRYKADVVNDGWLAGRDDAVAAASGRPEPIELTHIRYDTARFSFKPPEIVAARLKPFFVELALPGTKSERRAEEVRALSELGAGGFRRLHLAWEAMSNEDAVNEYYVRPPYHWRSIFEHSAGSQTEEEHESTYGVYSGGWQAERRGAWTNSAQKSNDSFKTELIEAIGQQYGWRPGDPPGPGSQEIATPSEGQNKVLRDVERALRTKLEQNRTEEDEGPSQAASPTSRPPPRVRIAARAPSTIMRIGGKVPYEPEHRLAMFCDRAAGGLGAWDS